MTTRITPVLKISVALIASFVLFGVLFPDQLEASLSATQSFMFETFGWYFQIIVTSFFIFSVYLALSKYGNITLGDPGEKPEFSRPVWFAMLFSAGIGIGLFFYGVSEPVAHFSSPPQGEGGGPGDVVGGVTYTWINWGIYAWSVYAIVALALALQQFRYKAPGLFSTTLRPVLGKSMNGPWGNAVDIVAVFATLFGVAASLGLGSQQINSGLNYLFDIPINPWIQLVIMSVITVIFVTSATTGIQRGIKYLSTLNITISGMFLLFMFIVGPTLFLLNTFVSSLAHYAQVMVPMALRMSPVDAQEAAWTQAWTIFYWAWWISWTPFVGMFIARVSRGRTIREFIFGVIFAPSLVTFFWFAVVGGNGIYLELYDGINISGQPLETALFNVLEYLPFSALVSVLTMFILVIFFVTTADSATFVLGMQTSGGDLNPSIRIKVLWGFIFVAATSILLFAGGLGAFQTMIVISALPLSVIMILMAIGIMKVLGQEKTP